ncbi:MAG: glycosyltransferase [Flammeovirgaceae bacterium]|jgi:glycosyltransferase involved in cell wall biosynthesis|nr:glycosyltransferase [Flammeovirgaceae bacterium]MEC8679244.1 glycosyltransferase [Bacteroidota bacterium]MEC8701828.1 glycosyltransferase [Bacteroidota bacterium]|tara:strand:- start:406 stop:1377 length:972 start_codon:yes stop_codon:yes gene_type:complete
MNLSIIIPAFNEEESIKPLVNLIFKNLDKNLEDFEIILIDDGSNDKTWDEIVKISNKFENIVSIKLLENYGKSDALDAGFKVCKGNYVLTMDADLQDDPSEILPLYSMIIENKYDLVSGWKKKRNDPLTKTIPSKFFNLVTRLFSGIKLNDFNCGIKIYRKEVINSINLYGEMHRYIPLIAKWNGFNKIAEKEVNHNRRKYGVTKFGMERYIRGFLDLLSVSFVYRFRKRPMHFFGSFGVLSFLLGFISAGFIIYEKISKLSQNVPLELIRPVTDQPLFYIALLAIIIGVQLFLVGFLSELIIQINSDKKGYKIEKTGNAQKK